MAAMHPSEAPLIERPPSCRWTQLFMGICCMVMIANLQYGWTLFVNPIADKHGWTKAAIQVAFTIFVITETWLVPIEGYLVDRHGPRLQRDDRGRHHNGIRLHRGRQRSAHQLHNQRHFVYGLQHPHNRTDHHRPHQGADDRPD